MDQCQLAACRARNARRWWCEQVIYLYWYGNRMCVGQRKLQCRQVEFCDALGMALDLKLGLNLLLGKALVGIEYVEYRARHGVYGL